MCKEFRAFGELDRLNVKHIPTHLMIPACLHEILWLKETETSWRIKRQLKQENNHVSVFKSWILCLKKKWHKKLFSEKKTFVWAHRKKRSQLYIFKIRQPLLSHQLTLHNSRTHRTNRMKAVEKKGGGGSNNSLLMLWEMIQSSAPQVNWSKSLLLTQ